MGRGRGNGPLQGGAIPGIHLRFWTAEQTPEKINEEEQLGVSEQLTEEELALFDILTKPEIDMTAKEKDEVKKVARILLQTLKEAKLVKVLARGELSKKLIVKAHAFSKKAAEQIASAGGQTEVVPRGNAKAKDTVE